MGKSKELKINKLHLPNLQLGQCGEEFAAVDLDGYGYLQLCKCRLEYAKQIGTKSVKINLPLY